MLQKVLGITVAAARPGPGMSGAAAAGRTTTAERLSGCKARVLLVEDNPTNQQVALAMLRLLGLSADTANQGKEALQALAARPYDLILMDCQMPEMDGYEATRHIRDPQSCVRDHAVPIIAMTANAMPEDRQQCLAAGMNDYLAKPISLGMLSAMLDKWLLGRQAGPATPPTAPPAVGQGATPRDTLVWNQAALMDRLMGNGEFAQMILDAFLQDMPLQLQRLREMLANGDVPNATRQAHTIKGASATVGGEAVRRVAAAIEEAGKAQDAAAMGARLGELEERMHALWQAIRHGLHELASRTPAEERHE